MKGHTKIVSAILVALVATAATMALVGCTQQPASNSGSASASASASATASASAASSSASASSSSGTQVVGAEDVVTIGLDYSAGTGYEWKCTMEPEDVVTLVSQETENKAKDQTIAGGPLRELFTFRAAKPGEVTLTFNLVREWEGEPAETQVYAFAVADDLKMVLNPYKSNFDNEPEWGSNS